MNTNRCWERSTKDLWALDKEQRCKFMILLRGPFDRTELAKILNVKLYTVYAWERRGMNANLKNLRALLIHFSDWYCEQGLPVTLAQALAEITQKKDLTPEKKPDKRAIAYQESEE